MNQVRLLIAFAHDHVQSIGAQPQTFDGLLMGRAQKRLPVNLEDSHADAKTTVASNRAAAIDFWYEDAFVVGVDRISALTLETAFDMHA